MNKEVYKMPKITATSLEEFTLVNDTLKKLPRKILDDIEVAQKGMLGVECIFKRKFEGEQKFYLPNKVTQIKPMGDYIAIYCGDFFFKILGENVKDIKNLNIEYNFIDCEEWLAYDKN